MRFGNCRVDLQTLPISATPDYSSGDNIGGQIAINMNGSVTIGGILKQIAMVDAAGLGPQLTILFFNKALTGTFTDNAAIAPDATDDSHFLGKVEIATTDWVTVASKKYLSKECSLAIVGEVVGTDAYSPKRIYAAIVCYATLNYAAATDLKIGFGICQD